MIFSTPSMLRTLGSRPKFAVLRKDRVRGETKGAQHFFESLAHGAIHLYLLTDFHFARI